MRNIVFSRIAVALPLSLLAIASPAAPQPPSVPGDLAITEFMPAPRGGIATAGEWFEIISASTFDLRGLLIANASGASFTVAADAPVTIAPGEFFVFGRGADAATNGGYLPDFVYSGVTMANTGGGLSISFDGMVIDSVAYATTVSGRSYEVGSDRNLHAAGDFPYGTLGNFGTPGAANFNAPPPLAAIPEPSTCGLLIAGLLLGWLMRRRPVARVAKPQSRALLRDAA